MKHKIHFDADGKGIIRPGYPECGQANAESATLNPSRVTCRRCIKSAAYKAAKEAK